MVKDHTTHHATKTKIYVKRISPGNWQWRVMDWFQCTIDYGTGCLDREDAWKVAGEARDKYLAEMRAHNERLKSRLPPIAAK